MSKKEEITLKPKDYDKKVTCKKHGEHELSIHLTESDEYICLLCVKDLVGTMDVEYGNS